MTPLAACFMSHGYSGTPAAKIARAALAFRVQPRRTGSSTGINTAATAEFHDERAEWCTDNVGRCAVFMSPYASTWWLASTKAAPLSRRTAGLLCYCCEGAWAAFGNRYLFEDGDHAVAFRLVYG